MNNVYEAKKVANYFLSKARGRLTPLQIQKLVYFAHGWTLAITGLSLIKEPIEVWPYGPVVSDLYHTHKHHGDSYIGGYNIKQTKGFDPIHQVIMDKVWDTYGEYNGLELSELTHREGTPWFNAKNNNISIILDEDMIRHFNKVLNIN